MPPALMVIDTSADFAAIAGEPDSDVYRSAIISAPAPHRGQHERFRQRRQILI
jgi:uncharacterized protein with PIN domain